MRKPAAATPDAQPRPNEVSVEVAGTAFSGWTSVTISAGIEQTCRTFEMSMTEQYPQEDTVINIAPADLCKVRVGNDLLLTGYLDQYAMSITPDSHEIHFSGRSKTQDLVDCSADWPQMQMQASTADDIARKLAEPYGIGVVCSVGDLITVPKLNILKGETVFEVIERQCRSSSLLVTDNEYGDLVLTQTGTEVAAGSIEMPGNVQAAEVTRSADQLYSEYRMYGAGYFKFQVDTGIEQSPILRFDDPVVMRRNRKLFLVAEHVQHEEAVGIRRLIWERNRRVARSQVVNVTVDSWRDAAGALWRPNTQVIVHMPALKVVNEQWLIAHITYRQDEQRGTQCDMVIMAPAAFATRPVEVRAIIDGATQAPIPSL